MVMEGEYTSMHMSLKSNRHSWNLPFMTLLLLKYYTAKIELLF